MKRLNKILLLVLAAAMTVPMLATLMPLKDHLCVRRFLHQTRGVLR